MENLTGKVALITGASRGIGRAIALRLASQGASIYLAADGTEQELTDTAAACRNAGAADAAWGVHDLSRPGEPEAMVAAAHQRLQRIDILVNNAGIRVRKAFEHFSHEEFDRVVAVNLRAAFFASQAAIPIMRRLGSGHIVHMASQLGIVASRYGAIYSLTKAGLIQLTKSMALEFAAPARFQRKDFSPDATPANSNNARVMCPSAASARRKKSPAW
jgi:NAD(P)-dependent dehydrogenase (short-subunit alcohol dehydrogenase family)